MIFYYLITKALKEIREECSKEADCFIDDNITENSEEFISVENVCSE